MTDLLEGKKSLDDLTKKYWNKIKMVASGYPAGNSESSQTARLAFSFSLVSAQIDNLNMKIDILAHIATELEKTFLSSIPHLTSDIVDTTELKISIEEKNKMLKKFGKKIGVDIANAFLPG